MVLTIHGQYAASPRQYMLWAPGENRSSSLRHWFCAGGPALGWRERTIWVTLSQSKGRRHKTVEKNERNSLTIQSRQESVSVLRTRQTRLLLWRNIALHRMEATSEISPSQKQECSQTRTERAIKLHGMSRARATIIWWREYLLLTWGVWGRASYWSMLASLRAYWPGRARRRV